MKGSFVCLSLALALIAQRLGTASSLSLGGISRKSAAKSPTTGLRLKAPLRVRGGVLNAVPPAPWAVAAACTVPTSLGFWKSEYGVSYGYGAAVAAAALLILPATVAPLVKAQAICLVFYGVRLCTFLLLRERLPRFRELREKIEKKAIERGGRLKRLPFIASCSVLYYGLIAPLLITAPAGLSATCPVAKAGIVGMWVGVLLAAWGDATKSWVKADRGPDHLVTSGPFRFFRHPNYTGELIMWWSNVLVAAAGGALLPMHRSTFVLSLLGLMGITFVLMQAATGLEKRQLEKYGETPEYREWVALTWAGPVLA